MKTLSEHNNSYEFRVESAMAGVLCDDCNEEMFYPDPYSMLSCIPPKMTVQCPKCHKIDYKIK